MRISGVFLLFAVSVMNSAQQVESRQIKAELVHVSNSFHFGVGAPLAQVAPLFGPEGERSWAGKHWNPEFLYPGTAKDIQGAVFTVQHGPHTSVWVNTVFDVQGGRMQYVYFIPDALVSTVDVRLTAIDESHTVVQVTYDRTALNEAANDEVQEMGNADRESGPQWHDAIAACLGANKR